MSNPNSKIDSRVNEPSEVGSTLDCFKRTTNKYFRTYIKAFNS